ncbi:MAG: HAMP domain-containing histidine kinase [Cyclobacteriaceae bacterium]|nr:HAMP domain-containing histidine kinase [Cyclobacteriaceae bacterium]
MKQHKNTLALTLMISSIVLLLILQIFWLRSSYEKAFYDFRRETNGLFRNTVYAIRDSIFAKSIEPVVTDSSISMHVGGKTPDSVQWTITSRDSTSNSFKIRDHATSVQLFIRSTSDGNDSVASLLKPLASHMQGMQGQRSFIIRLQPDSLNLDSLARAYSKALKNASITVPVHIRSSEKDFNLPGPLDSPGSFQRTILRERRMEPPLDRPEKLSIFRDTLLTDFVGVNPVKQYQAVLTNIRMLTLKEITPQIFFSLFLTIITVTSFVLMYRSMRSQQRLMELKNDFISNVTHELKTPVATVSVALEALKNFHALDKPERTQEYLDIAQKELNRLTLMTDKILKTSVFESKGVEYIPENLNLETIIEKVIASMKLIFEKRHATVSFTKTGNNFVVTGSEIHLTNVVLNLLDNALKYSTENPKISISLSEDVHQIQLTVRDQGIGIEASYQKKIFEKFFRVPSGDIHNTKGYGLGLSYVTSVVTSHGGKITVSSDFGKGSTFTVTLPKQV